MVVLSACNNFEESFKYKSPDPFLELYSARDVKEFEAKVDKKPLKLYDFSASKMPLTQFIRWFSDRTGCGVVYGAGADNSELTAEYKKASPDDIMNSISRRFGLELIKINNTYYLGQLKPEDRGYLVRRIKGYSSAEIQAAIATFNSEVGKVCVQRDGLVIVSDRESILSNVVKVFDALESGTGETWILQFYLVTLKKELALAAGADVATSGQVAYQLSGSAGDKDASKVAMAEAATAVSAIMSQSLNAVLSGASNYVDIKATPMFLLRDGTSGEWQDGLSVPIPKKSVSQYGVVTTEGFEYVDTGLVLKATLRESSKGAYLTVDFTDSSIKGYVEYQPIISKSCLKTESEIQSCKIYLLGELNKRDSGASIQKLLDFSSTESFSNIQLFCRAYKVGLPLPYALETDKESSESVVDPSMP